ncbi:MAG TPA: hypothetical protein DCE23_01025 [Firmicutes bacterium]|nr:hypothetical protein [Bacillota bacterium]
MKKIIYMLLIMIILSLFIKPKETYYIPNDSIRFRIIANSNSNIDQTTKLLIKKDLEDNFFPLLEQSASIEETRNIINNNQDILDNTINKYNIPYTVNYGKNYFPPKEYLGVKYDEGNYESLVVSLGEGEGNNWWCVMYPPLCLLESKEEKQEVEYKSFIKELIEKLTS